MTYTPITAGTLNWDVPLNAALTDLDTRTTTVTASDAGKVSKVGDTLTGTLNNTGSAATSVTYASIVSADGFNRFQVRADGRMDWGPGNVTRDTDLYRSGVASLSTDGFFAMGAGQSSGDFSIFTGATKALRIGTAGGGLAVAEGTNARSGVATLAGGAATVANTSVTAITRIQLTSNADGGTPGFLRVDTRTAGTSFHIQSSSGTDTSTVAWFLVEPN